MANNILAIIGGSGLYDVEESAQTDIVDSGQVELDIAAKFTAKKNFQELKYD